MSNPYAGGELALLNGILFVDYKEADFIMLRGSSMHAVVPMRECAASAPSARGWSDALWDEILHNDRTPRSRNSQPALAGGRVTSEPQPLACGNRDGTAGLPRPRAAGAVGSAAPTRRHRARSGDRSRASHIDGGARQWPTMPVTWIRCAAAPFERALGDIGGGRFISMRIRACDTACAC